VLKSNDPAIPPLLAALDGSNHIGGIDVYNGNLYGPIEDGSAYTHPYIVLFNPSDLSATSNQYPLDATMMPGGVPWVAVDGPRQALYTAPWDPTPVLLVHDLTTVTYQKSISLTPALSRIQGGKVFEAMLYLSTDDATKDIFKVNLETGTAIPLFSITGTGVEEEDLCFNGSTMYTMADISSAASVELRHHTRSRDPLRKAVCP
jgi:hypothetical protein